MLSGEDNALLSQAGPGTPLGAVLRRYWIPFLLSRELPDAGGGPLRVTLLNEQLVAYRDANGRVGLLGVQCPHRGASLFFGRNEEPEPGLRCVYHGWKFDLDGRCIEVPNEPPDTVLKDTVRHLAYPCSERGGIVWTYLGPPELSPPLPEFEFLTVPQERRYITRRIQECNWLQALEGGLDSSHISFLHRGNYSDDLGDIYCGDPAPKFFVVPAEYGLLIAARRTTGGSGASFNWRNTPWIMPWYMLIPYPEGQVFGGHCWIPIDDQRCTTWTFSWRADRALSRAEVELFDSGVHIHSRLIPGTCRPAANALNDYLIDRDVQRSRKSYTGIFGSGPQDAAVQESMGPIYDRTREHLGASDAAIIATRRHLLRALRDPGYLLGLEPSTHHVRAVDMNLPPDADFMAETRDKMRAN